MVRMHPRQACQAYREEAEHRDRPTTRHNGQNTTDRSERSKRPKWSSRRWSKKYAPCRRFNFNLSTEMLINTDGFHRRVPWGELLRFRRVMQWAVTAAAVLISRNRINNSSTMLTMDLILVIHSRIRHLPISSNKEGVHYFLIHYKVYLVPFQSMNVSYI